MPSEPLGWAGGGEPSLKPPRRVEVVGVVGAGRMGRLLAELMAYNGYSVILLDRNEETLKGALRSIEEDLIRRREVTPGLEDLPSRIRTTTTLKELEAAQLVIECIIEELGTKRRLFKEVSGIVGAETILATNTSSLSLEGLAKVVRRPERFLGLHFLNPPTLLRLIEVAGTDATDEEFLSFTLELAASWRNFKGPMIPIRVKPIPGYIVTRLLMAMVREALALKARGVADERSIDEAMRLGAKMPLGPFELMEFVGIDLVRKVNRALGPLAPKGESSRVLELAGQRGLRISRS